MNALGYIVDGAFLAIIALFIAFLDYGVVRFAIPSERSRLNQIDFSILLLGLNTSGAGGVCSVINLWFSPTPATSLGRIGAILLLFGAACAIAGGVLMLLDQRRSGNR
jgi:hypothetical protein